MELIDALNRGGRNAKNIGVYQIRDEPLPSSANKERICVKAIRKPPIKSTQNIATRVRSASTGRDKKSEFQARYWALLFGNLQRAVNEIFQTVECCENITWCQEVILVLENYVRDFKALSEWFKVSWDYESLPMQQKPLSLAWEVRKSNPFPRLRAKSFTSPAASAKSSPYNSGKSSPNCGADLMSPRKCTCSCEHFSKSLRSGNTRNILTSKKQENGNHCSQEEKVELELGSVELLVKHHKSAQTDLEDDHLTLADMREKMSREKNLISTKIRDKEEEGFQYMKPAQQTQEAEEINCASILAEVCKKNTQKELTNNGPLKYSSVLNRPVIARTANKLPSQKSSICAATSRKSIKTLGGRSSSSLSISASVTKPVNGLLSCGGPLCRKIPSVSKSGKIDNVRSPNQAALRLSARSHTMIEMTSKDSKSSSGLTPMTSRKLSRGNISNSTSTLKSGDEFITSKNGIAPILIVPVDERPSSGRDMFESNDGWLTVKNRRRSSMHWSNRFNQPTGYASLPTLALYNEKSGDEDMLRKLPNRKGTAIESKIKTETVQSHLKNMNREPKVMIRPEIKNAKPKVNSLPKQLENPLTIQTEDVKMIKQKSIISGTTNSCSTVPSRNTIIKRQKSELTGLKITSLHKEYMRSEKFSQKKHSNQLDHFNKAALKSSVGTVAEGSDKPLGNYAANHGIVAGDQNKIDIKIQTNQEFSKTIGNLCENILPTAKAAILKTNIMDRGENNLSSCDESEEASVNETDCDEDQRMLVEEQKSLERQIRELESTEIDVDTETDETDGEIPLESEQDCHCSYNVLGNTSSAFMSMVEDGINTNLSLEMRYQVLLSEMSRVEREEALATLKAYVARHPGRAQELHQKLSSPSRGRSLQETLKKYQAKQARAQLKREQLQKEKANKIQQLLARVEDVKTAKRQLIENKRMKMEDKMQRAAENREQFLRQIVEKAHDEEKKLKEINFIKNIEAQNKRLDLIESSKETEWRLQDLEQERQKRLEEKAAKEAAVERRRQELEKERQRKLEKINETRLEKEQRIGKMQEQKERQRQALAREKARDREERLLARQVQQQQTTEELQRKILQKQQDSARRHEENIEHIRQRAMELTIPTRTVDENGQQSEDFNASTKDDCLSSAISEVGSRELNRGYKKKLKKLKQRMAQSTDEYMKEQQPVLLHMKRESQVPKYLNLVTKGGGAQGLERALGHLLRLIGKAQVVDFQCFLLMDGLGVITKTVISKCIEENIDVSKRSIVLAVQLYRNACTLCPQIARHAILGNSLSTLFDVLHQSLQLPESKSPQHPVELSTELMLACTVAMSPSYTKKHTHPKVMERLPDLISYCVIIGLFEILSRRCIKIRESIENHQSVVLSLLATLGLLTRFIDICPSGPTDMTRFLSAAKSTELFGTITMLYSCVVPIGECIPPRTISLAAATFNLLVSIAVLDLTTFQEVLTSEAISMKFLDVITILLKYCGNKFSATNNSETQSVIIDLIATIGFLCANNKKNQDKLTSEQCSLIIKSLTKLPEHFNVVVYPCLFTITFQNEAARNVIARDFDLKFLDEYCKSEKAEKNHLIALVKGKS